MARQKLTERNSVTTSTSTDYIHVVQGGVSYKIQKQHLLSGVLSGFVGALAIADTPTEDGIYICSESGTYTNAGSLVVDLTTNLTFISVEDSQTTFELIEIPVSSFGYNVVSSLSNFNSLISGATTGTWLILSSFTLDGNKTLPSGVTLEFRGGIISGAFTITGDDTKIVAEPKQIFNTNVTLVGTWNTNISYPEWFGATGDGATDDTTEIQKVLDFGGKVEFMPQKTYVSTGLTLSTSKSTYLELNGCTLKLSGSGTLIDIDNNHDFSLQNSINNGYLDSTTLGSGIAILNTDTDRTEFNNLLIRYFDKGIMLDASADGGYSESCFFKNVTIRSCDYGIYLGGSAWTSTTISYGQTRFIGVNVSTSGASAAVAYGFYQEQHTSLYRTTFATATFWTETNNAVGFFTDGAFNGVFGQIGIERIGSTGNTAFQVGSNATLIQGDLIINIAGVFATEFDLNANISYQGIRKKAIQTIRKQGYDAVIDQVTDEDGTVRISRKVTNTDTIQERYNSTNPLEILNNSTGNLFEVRAKIVGKVSTVTGNDTTPSVINLTFLRLNNSSATTITNFDDGVAGQEITVLHLNTNTTISATNIVLSGAVDVTGTIGMIHKFIYDGNSAKWRETSRI